MADDIHDIDDIGDTDRIDGIGQCLVFERCVQVCAEVRVPAEILFGVFGLEPPRFLEGQVDIAVTAVPVLAGRLLKNKVIRCGSLPAVALVRLGPSDTRCLPIHLAIEGEEEAPGVRPSDRLVQRTVALLGATVCRVEASVPRVELAQLDCGFTLTERLAADDLFLFKAALLVQEQVLRPVTVFPPCPPEAVCPPPDPAAAVAEQAAEPPVIRSRKGAWLDAAPRGHSSRRRG